MIKIKSYGSGSKGNCYLVSNSKSYILLECGFNINYIIKRLITDDNLKINDLDCVLISHVHKDHSMALHDLNDYMIPIYCSNQTIQKYNLSSVNDLSKIKCFNIENLYILPISVKHGDCECYGFIFHDEDSTILFLTDFMLMEYDLSAFKFDEIFIETNFCENKINQILENENEDNLIKVQRQINTHCSLENAITYLKNMDLSKCKNIHGIHLSKDFANEKEIIFKIQNEFGIPTSIINYKGEAKND